MLLCFFISNQKISPEQRGLEFEKNEIENLWSHALLLDPSVSAAEELYWQNENDEAVLKQCADHLRTLWLSVNAIEEDLQEQRLSHLSPQYGVNNLVNNPLLTKTIQQSLKPFLLPSDSSIYSAVDEIFSSSRVTFNDFTLAQAGFHIICRKQPRSFITVASHGAVPGFLFKLYYDTELRTKNGTPGWKWFVRRCSGAELIRNVIHKKNIKYFKVPQKYIYVLPPSTIPATMPGVMPQISVLVVEDMKLADDVLNYHAWKTFITPQILDELYIIISRANGSSYRPDNIPYTQSGHFAFIDTEYPYQDPDFYSIRPYLSYDMCVYWDKLVKKGGP